MNVAPVVSMLWEEVDADQALVKRFGFADTAAASAWVAETLARTWEIGIDHCERLVISGWNAMAWVTAGERQLIAKWSALPHRFSHLKDAASVTASLGRSGIPVPAPIPALDGERLVELPNLARGRLRSALPLPGSRFLVGVLPVHDGDLLDVDDETQVVQAGEMLAFVHDALAVYSGPVDGRRPVNGEQLVHNDFRSANLLHDGGRITGVLDLEEIKHDTTIADLAKAAVMLGTQYRHWAPTTADVRSTFIASYGKQRHLTAADKRELEARIAAVLSEKWWASHRVPDAGQDGRPSSPS